MDWTIFVKSVCKVAKFGSGHTFLPWPPVLKASKNSQLYWQALGVDTLVAMGTARSALWWHLCVREWRSTLWKNPQLPLTFGSDKDSIQCVQSVPYSVCFVRTRSGHNQPIRTKKKEVSLEKLFTTVFKTDFWFCGSTYLVNLKGVINYGLIHYGYVFYGLFGNVF